MRGSRRLRGAGRRGSCGLLRVSHIVRAREQRKKLLVGYAGEPRVLHSCHYRYELRGHDELMIATGPDSYASTDEAGCSAPGLSRRHRETWFEIEEKMFNSRRGFLAGAAATIGTMPLARPPAAQKSEV